MTVSTTTNHEEYVGNGTTTVFPYRFRIFKNSDLVVIRADPDGVLTTLVLGTDYEVTGANLVTGGEITLSEPLLTGWVLTIDRELKAVQETDFRNQGRFYAETHEDALDYLTMLFQQAFSYADLALRKPAFLSKYYDARNNLISNLADPRLPQDAVTKAYSDEGVEGAKSYTSALVKSEADARAAADAALLALLSGTEPLPASAFSVISWHKQIVDTSVIIPDYMNAWSFGPVITVSPGQQVTIPDHSVWTIANGQQVNNSGANVDYGEL